MFLRHFFIQTVVVLAWYSTPVLCADNLGHCQKSGCRTSSDAKVRSRRPDFATPSMSQTPATAQRQKYRLYTLLVEWIMVFFFLRIFLYIKLNGCPPICRRIQKAKSSVASSFDLACTSILHQISGVSGSRTRESRGGSLRRRLSRGSTQSLGSLADLIGWDENSEMEAGSFASSTYAYDSSSQASDSFRSSSVDTSVSYYTESESEATNSMRKWAPRVSSLSSLASTAAVKPPNASKPASSSDKKAKLSPKSRLNKYDESDANGSYTRGNDGNDSDSVGHSSSGSILSKFMDFLSTNSAKKKKKGELPHEKDRGSRRPSLDENGLTQTFGRPLHYDGNKRRSTVDNPSHYKNGDKISTRPPAPSSIKPSSLPHRNGIKLRHTTVGQRDSNAKGPPVHQNQNNGRTKLKRIQGTPQSEQNQDAAISPKDDQSLLEQLLEHKQYSFKGISTAPSASDSMTDVTLQSVASYNIRIKP